MAKRKQKNELENTSNETTSIEQQNKEINEVLEDNKISETTNEKTNNKTKEKQNTTKEKEYIITKKSEGVYIRKLRRL